MPNDMERTFEFIVNPIAGPKDNIRYFKQLKGRLREAGIAFDSKKTKRAGHAPKLVQKRLDRSEAVIVSVGGDGTFNEVASVMVDSERPMAHIPRGSGNGLARMLKIPGAIAKIPDYLKHGVSRQIDVGKINNNYFFCTCGFGFDALIAHHFATSKQRGLKSYVWYVLKAFFNFKGIEAEFVLDGEPVRGRYFAVTIANANQYGNDAFIAPEADLQDELLDVTMIRPFPLWYTPVMGIALFGKWIHKTRYVETRKVRRVEINAVSSPWFHCDGDVYQPEFPTRISVLPQALRLLVPMN